MRYSWDIEQYARRMLHTLLRKTGIVGFLVALLKPLEQLHGTFLARQAGLVQRSSYTVQRRYLERALNDIYDLTSIEVIDGRQLPRLPVHNLSEGILSPILYNESELNSRPRAFSYNESELGPVTADFIVRVPTAVWSAIDQNQFRDYVNRYKAAGKSYTIQVF